VDDEGGQRHRRRLRARLPASMAVTEDGGLVLRRPLAAGTLILAGEGEEEDFEVDVQRITGILSSLSENGNAEYKEKEVTQ